MRARVRGSGEGKVPATPPWMRPLLAGLCLSGAMAVPALGQARFDHGACLRERIVPSNP